jgi:hypothetical protein
MISLVSGNIPKAAPVRTLHMPLTPPKKFLLVVSTVLLITAAFFLFRYHHEDRISSRDQLLTLVPADASAVIFLDADELKQSPFLAKLYSWAPHPTEDSEYSEFVRDTGFSWERDLQRIIIAVSPQASTNQLFAVADGSFDRKKIEAFLTRNGQSTQQGKLKIFHLNATPPEKPLTIWFLSDRRIALTDAENFSQASLSPADAATLAEWRTRFNLVAGVPLFAVIHQNAALQNAVNYAAPNGFRSPQFSALLNQLQWISIAAKPEADTLRVVAEGDTPSAGTSAQLREFLQGILLLAQNGLNDPKLRQSMNAQERTAYLDILRSADVQTVNRGESSSVRLILELTPGFLDAARDASRVTPKPEPAEEQHPSKNASRNRSTRKMKP